MKKLTVLAFLCAAVVGVFLGARPAEAQTAPSQAELSPEVAQSLKLALDATELVLDQVELSIKEDNASVNPVAVRAQLSGMQGTLVALDRTLDGSPAVAGVQSPSSAVAAVPSAPAGPVTQAPLVTAPHRPAPAAEAGQGEETSTIASDSSENDRNAAGNLASIGDTLGSNKVVWPVAIILILLVAYFGFFFRRGKAKPKAPAPAKAAS